MIKPVLLLVFTSLLATLSIRAGDFDNWYFKFFSVPTEARGKFFDPGGKQVETVTGTSIAGKLSEDGREFVQKYQFTYKEMGKKVEATLKWKSGANRTYSGSYEDSNGTRASYTLALKEGMSFETKSIGPDGVSIESTGHLNKDGEVEANDRMLTAEGELMIRIESVISRKKGAGE